MKLSKEDKLILNKALKILRYGRGYSKQFDVVIMNNFKKDIFSVSDFGSCLRKESIFNISDINYVQGLLCEFEEELKRLKQHRKFKQSLYKKRNKNG